MNTVSLLVTLLLCAPALVFTARRSSWMFDYLFAVVAFNRGLRRVVDYHNGFFDPLSPISLTPLVVSGLAAALVLDDLFRRRQRVGATANRVLKWYLTASAMAFAVGLYRNRAAALFDMGNYLAPLGMMGLGVMFADKPQVLRRWATSAAVIGIAVAAYGLYQFYTIPPWDAFWVRAVGFEGYLGTLAPTKMTLFSTLNERGPAAMFLASTLILLLLRPTALGPLQLAMAPVVAVALLYTYSRTTIIYVVLACVALPLVMKGRGSGSLAALALILLVFGDTLLGFLPEADRVAQRYATLGDIQDDGSFRTRLILLRSAAQSALAEPLGLGMGSHGTAGRIAASEQRGVTDTSGYMEILRTFGWIGAGLIVALLVQLWRSSAYLMQHAHRDPDLALFRAWFVAGMVVLFSANWLAGVSYFWVLAGYVVARADAVRHQALAPALPRRGLPGDGTVLRNPWGALQ